jgi:hypothetical protein
MVEEVVQCHAVATLPSGKRQDGPRAGLDQRENFDSEICSPACPARSKLVCASCVRNYGVIRSLVTGTGI